MILDYIKINYSHVFMLTSPLSRYISPSIAESNKDLPDPEAPTTIINFPEAK